MKIVMVLVSMVATISIYGQSDFSGTWKLNAEKSQFNNTPGAPTSGKLVVEQKAGTITFQRNDNTKETLKIDSTSEIEVNTLGFEDSKTKVSMKLTADKKGLVETRTYTYSEGEQGVLASKKIRTWTLSVDKKVLTITDQIEASNEETYLMVLVYERQ